MTMRIALTLLAAVLLPGGGARAAAPYTGQPYDPAMGGPRSAEMVFAAPAQPDFLFRDGAEIAIDCHPVPRAVSLSWTLHRNLVKTPLREGTVGVAVNNRFPVRIATDGLGPGWYDLRVTVDLTERRRLEGVTVFAWRPDAAPVLSERPDDFAAFWRKAKERVAAVELRLERAPYATFRGDAIGRYNTERASLPEHPDPAGERFDEVVVSKVTFRSVDETTLHAWFARPPGAGPFPGLLILPGAGNRYRPIPLEAARHGYAALDLQVHGEPVDWPNARYSPLPKEDPSRPEGMLYHALVHHALQGVNALAALEEVDPRRLAVEGSSQGGYLTIAAAALDDRVRAGVATLPYLAHRAYPRWAGRMNRERKPGAGGPVPWTGKLSARARSERYLDALHFAPDVGCPLFLNAGLCDTVSPPSTVYAVHQLARESVFVPLPNAGHDVTVAGDRAAWRWLEAELPPAE